MLCAEHQHSLCAVCCVPCTRPPVVHDLLDDAAGQQLVFVIRQHIQVVWVGIQLTQHLKGHTIFDVMLCKVLLKLGHPPVEAQSKGVAGVSISMVLNTPAVFIY